MARELDLALLMTASGSLDIFLRRMLRMKLFSVIFHLPDYKAISNTMQQSKQKHAFVSE